MGKNINGNYNSTFDGSLLQYIGWSLLCSLISIVTLGIMFPTAYCLLYRWQVRHTVICGRRLDFDGRGIQLIGRWILWLLLAIVTIGIFALWIPIKLEKWKVSHTYFADKK